MRMFAVVVLVLALAAFAIGLFVASPSSGDRPKCTHGSSSIGPVTIDKNGNTTGNTTPVTEECLP